jgi:tRNA modification GTPase
LTGDTIAALATPPGDGGIGVIRLSGPEAVAVASRFFRAADGVALSQQPARMLTLGTWRDAEGRVLDELLCVRFQAPHSFTGEEVVELQAHGGAFHLRTLLKSVLGARVRLARPGEFTQRAFINGKMDLTRAEAVADLINAGTDMAREAAARQLSGGLFELVEGLRRELVELSAQVEAAVDFPDDEDQLLPRAALLARIQALGASIRSLIAGARQGRLLSQGLRVTLLGRPNVGKSSLMNALLGEQRSIVTPDAGTTRDYIEERFSLQGFPVLLTDTAGLRESEDPAEREGVRRSRERLRDADLLLLVLDASAELGPEDFAGLDDFHGDFLVVANKTDLGTRWGDFELKKFVAGPRRVGVSCKTGSGLEDLKAGILDKALGSAAAGRLDAVRLTQARHEEAMRRAEFFVSHVEKTLGTGKLSAEFLSGDLRGALDALGEIVGTTSREEVINAIFEKFCIGK